MLKKKSYHPYDLKLALLLLISKLFKQFKQVSEKTKRRQFFNFVDFFYIQKEVKQIEANKN